MGAWTASALAWTFRARRTRLDAELLAFGEVFRGRLCDYLLDDALEYVGFNEPLLAVEILADQLGEYDVRVTRDEWERLAQLYEFWGGDPTRRKIVFLEPGHRRYVWGQRWSVSGMLQAPHRPTDPNQDSRSQS